MRFWHFERFERMFWYASWVKQLFGVFLLQAFQRDQRLVRSIFRATALIYLESSKRLRIPSNSLLWLQFYLRSLYFSTNKAPTRTKPAVAERPVIGVANFERIFWRVELSTVFLPIDAGIGASKWKRIGPKICGAWIFSFVLCRGSRNFVYIRFLNRLIATVLASLFFFASCRKIFFLSNFWFDQASSSINMERFFMKGMLSAPLTTPRIWLRSGLALKLVFSTVWLQFIFKMIWMIWMTLLPFWGVSRMFSVEIILVERNPFVNKSHWWKFSFTHLITRKFVSSKNA